MVDFENEMVRQAKKRDCHTVVCGHIHNPEDKWIDGVRYLNTGDWIENCSYLTYYNLHGTFKLCKNYSPS
jgi:UDP-2,3-diacylglucosamine pyrophosphatase LpxH